MCPIKIGIWFTEYAWENPLNWFSIYNSDSMDSKITIMYSFLSFQTSIMSFHTKHKINIFLRMLQIKQVFFQSSHRLWCNFCSVHWLFKNYLKKECLSMWVHDHRIVISVKRFSSSILIFILLSSLFFSFQW